MLLSKCNYEVLSFIEKHNIPVVTTMMGISVVPTEHKLCYGMVGNNGKPYANRAMNEADLLIMVGASVADRSVTQPDLVTKGKVVVHIDVDPAEIGILLMSIRRQWQLSVIPIPSMWILPYLSIS